MVPGVFEAGLLFLGVMIVASGELRARALRASARGVGNSDAWSHEDLGAARWFGRRWVPLAAVGILLAGLGLYLRMGARPGGDILEIAGVMLAAFAGHSVFVVRELGRLESARSG